MAMVYGFAFGLLVSFFTAVLGGPSWAAVGLGVMTFSIVGILTIVGEEIEKPTK